MRDSVDRKNDLERRLRKAIQDRRLNLHYQPIVHSSTQKIIGLEALLRWDSGNEGVLPAGQFIQVAERLGLCSIFSDWALLTAGQQLGKWMDDNLIKPDDDFRLSINVCADQLTDPEFPSRVNSVLDQNNLPPSLLALDLAEGIVQSGHPQAKSNMLKLQEMGIALNLDDFSQAFPTLQEVSDIPFFSLKLDQNVVPALLDNPNGEHILKALVVLAHRLGFVVVVEGVESEHAGQWFQSHGCDGLQGYHYSRPLPAPEMEALLKSQQH